MLFLTAFWLKSYGDHRIRNPCEIFGFIEAPINESIIIFHWCSSNLKVKLSTDTGYPCLELHIGNTPRSIMTKGTSTRRKNRLPGMLYGNFDPGDQDKLMITYQRDPEHDYALSGACGVVYQGNIHFFGGNYIGLSLPKYDFSRQHFYIETQRKGRIVKMTKMENLDIGFDRPSCSSFEITSAHFSWLSKNIVILCFPYNNAKSCYSYDGKIKHLGDSNFYHNRGGLTKYRSNLLTVGGNDIKTELMERKKNGSYIWSEAESDAIFSQYEYIHGHSLVTIPSHGINDEYILLIGGIKANGEYIELGEPASFIMKRTRILVNR